MGRLHNLLEERGVEEVRKTDVAPRDAIEAAAQYMSDEEHLVGFAYSGWAQCALPHRRTPPGEVWMVQNGPTTLLIEPGHLMVKDEAVVTSVPFGVYARLILLFLQTEAIRTNSPNIELGRSWRAWLGTMGISIGGKTWKSVKEQAELIAHCRLSFRIKDGNRSGLVNQSIVDGALFLEDPKERSRQSRLSLEHATLSQPFFDQLVKHAFPVDHAAIGGLMNNSAAMDVYLWLAYRLHNLQTNTKVSWHALYSQHGQGYKEVRLFRRRFREVLTLAMAVYPEAKVEVLEDGVLLKPSKPPVPTQVIIMPNRTPLTPRRTFRAAPQQGGLIAATRTAQEKP